MRVAVIADAHGNLQAVEAALDAIQAENVDLVVAAGDMINPFPGSVAIWNLLHSENVPCLKGGRECVRLL